MAAQLRGEGRQVEQVEQGVAPPLGGGPVVEVPEALVRRIQDRPQHRSVLAPVVRRPPVLLRAPGVTLQDRRRLLCHGQPERPGQQRPLHHQDAIVVCHSASSIVHRGCPAFAAMMRTGSDISAYWPARRAIAPAPPATFAPKTSTVWRAPGTEMAT